jgi:hypothetical protein
MMKMNNEVLTCRNRPARPSRRQKRAQALLFQIRRQFQSLGSAGGTGQHPQRWAPSKLDAALVSRTQRRGPCRVVSCWMLRREAQKFFTYLSREMMPHTFTYQLSSWLEGTGTGTRTRRRGDTRLLRREKIGSRVSSSRSMK